MSPRRCPCHARPSRLPPVLPRRRGRAAARPRRPRIGCWRRPVGRFSSATGSRRRPRSPPPTGSGRSTMRAAAPAAIRAAAAPLWGRARRRRRGWCCGSRCWPTAASPAASGLWPAIADPGAARPRRRGPAAAGLAASTVVRLSGGEVVALRRPVARVEAPGYGPLRALHLAAPGAAAVRARGAGRAARGGNSGPCRPRGRATATASRAGPGAMPTARWGGSAGRPTSPACASRRRFAALEDIGLSSPLFPAGAGDCTPAQAACLARARWRRRGGGRAGRRRRSTSSLAYLAALPPPQPQAAPDPRGQALFAATGCAACHLPALDGADGRGAGL